MAARGAYGDATTICHIISSWLSRVLLLLFFASVRPVLGYYNRRVRLLVSNEFDIASRDDKGGMLKLIIVPCRTILLPSNSNLVHTRYLRLVGEFFSGGRPIAIKTTLWRQFFSILEGWGTDHGIIHDGIRRGRSLWRHLTHQINPKLLCFIIFILVQHGRNYRWCHHTSAFRLYRCRRCNWINSVPRVPTIFQIIGILQTQDPFLMTSGGLCQSLLWRHHHRIPLIQCW